MIPTITAAKDNWKPNVHTISPDWQKVRKLLLKLEILDPKLEEKQLKLMREEKK